MLKNSASSEQKPLLSPASTNPARRISTPPPHSRRIPSHSRNPPSRTIRTTQHPPKNSFTSPLNQPSSHFTCTLLPTHSPFSLSIRIVLSLSDSNADTEPNRSRQLKTKTPFRQQWPCVLRSWSPSQIFCQVASKQPLSKLLWKGQSSMARRQVFHQGPWNGGLGMPDLKSNWLDEKLAYLGWSLSRETEWGQKVRVVFPRLKFNPKAEGRIRPRDEALFPASAVSLPVNFLSQVTFLGLERNCIGS